MPMQAKNIHETSISANFLSYENENFPFSFPPLFGNMGGNIPTAPIFESFKKISSSKHIIWVYFAVIILNKK